MCDVIADMWNVQEGSGLRDGNNYNSGTPVFVRSLESVTERGKDLGARRRGRTSFNPWKASFAREIMINDGDGRNPVTDMVDSGSQPQKLELNVIDHAVNPVQLQSAITNPASVSPKSPPTTALTMPNLDLKELVLHSPSSQIVGTPFATTTDRFEYPFPDTSPSSTNTSINTPVPYVPSTQSVFHSPPLGTTNYYNTIPSIYPVSVIRLPPSFPPPPEVRNYNPTHPKLRAPTNPPVPPGLIKKRHRWSLSLLGRRRSAPSPGEGEVEAPLTSRSTDGNITSPDMAAISDDSLSPISPLEVPGGKGKRTG